MNNDKSDNKSTNGKDDDTNNAEGTANRNITSASDSSNGHADEYQRNVVLESDIVAKQQGRSSVAAIPGAYSTSNIHSSTETVNPQISNFEADILAKQRAGSSQVATFEQDVAAKQKGRSASVQPAKPGAYSTSAISSDNCISPVLRDAEADILAKHRAAGASKIVPVHLEQDIEAKQLGRLTNVIPARPGAYNLSSSSSKSHINPALRNIEADIVAKQRAGASHSNTDIPSTLLKNEVSTTPGAYLSSTADANEVLRNLESDIRAKQANMNSKTITGTWQVDDDRNMRKQAPMVNTSVELTATASRANVDNAIIKVQNENRAVNMNGNCESPSKAARGVLDPNIFSGAIDSNTVLADDFGNKSKKDEQTQSALQQDNLNDLEYGEYGEEGADGLAIAVAVEEQDTETYLPSAIEFDPDTKPPMYRNRRFRLYLCLMMAAAVVGTVGAALGIVLTAQDGLPPQTIPYRATIGIRENLARIVSLEQLDDVTSPYKKAMDWITLTDPMAVTPDSSNFLNRFVLAYLYYATSQKKPWTTDCAPSDSTNENCVDVFPRNTVEEKYFNRTAIKWFTNTDECEWAGVTCDGFHQIRSIEFSAGMSGTFPEGLALLPYLAEFDLRFNELEGPLPLYVAKWKNLVDVGLQGCAFTGTIPELWFESRSWTHLHMESNQLTGTLPKNVTKLEDLKELSLSLNKLSGSLTTELGIMANLMTLELDSNQFKGTIPRTFGKMSQLEAMDLSRNSITGTIPNEIGGCTGLYDLFLINNLLTGSLPPTFWELTNLLYVNIGGNMLTGPITNRLSKFTYLREFEIQNNQFNGSFPFRLMDTDIWTIRASGNKFDGNVSTELCKLVEKGQLKKLEFDCATPIGGGTPEIFCPDDCCSICCNSDGEDCVEL